MNKELKLLYSKIAAVLDKKIDIPYCPAWLEKIIFNKLIRILAEAVVNSIKRMGKKDA